MHNYVYSMDIYKVTKNENINLLWSWNWNFFSLFAKIVYPIHDWIYMQAIDLHLYNVRSLVCINKNSALWILTLLIKIKLRTLGRWHFVYLHKIFGLAEMNTTYWGQMFIYLISATWSKCKEDIGFFLPYSQLFGEVPEIPDYVRPWLFEVLCW